MESRSNLAARVREIAPFHVMEVQTAARALEAAGRSVIHMEIGEPDFPTPAPVLAAAQRALADGGIYYTSALGIPELRDAIARHYADHLGVAVAPERVIVTAGSSAALLLVMALLVDRDDRILLADPGYPCNRHFVRILEGEPVGMPVGPDSGYQLSAELIERHWTPRTRGALIASPSNPTGTMVAPEEMRAHRGDRRAAVRAPDRRRDLPRPVLRRRAEIGAVARRRLRRRSVRRLQLFQVLQHDRMAPGLDRRAGAPRARPRDARAEPLHLAADAVPARRARLLRAGDPRDRRGAPARVPRPPRFPRAGAARARLRHPGDAERRLLRLCRQLALLARQRALLPRGAGRRAAWRSRRASISASHRASDHVRFAYTIEMAKLEEGVARLGAVPAAASATPRSPVAQTRVLQTTRLRQWRRSALVHRLALRRCWRSPAARRSNSTGRGSPGSSICSPARSPSTRSWQRRTDPALKERLARAQAIRAFASRELALPDNGSYTRYADLGRPFVVWNVFAAPELSLTPRQWCFPIAGCVNYRGYFAEADARAEGGAARGRPATTSTSAAFPRIRRSAISTIRCSPASSAIASRSSRGCCSTSSRTRSSTSRTTRRSTSRLRSRSRRRACALAGGAAAPARRRGARRGRRARRPLQAEFRALVRRTRERLDALYASDAPDADKRAARRRPSRRCAPSTSG